MGGNVVLMDKWMEKGWNMGKIIYTRAKFLVQYLEEHGHSLEQAFGPS